MRTIELPENDVLFRLGEKADYIQLQEAIGYLAMWGLQFPTVRIYPGGWDGDLVAVYLDAEGTRRYTIGAVWREDEKKFSFHS